ncbi:MAG: DUF2336 domain-containing protein [Fimbriimonadaceae bacterium]|nr:DUF2336 domain-containing protein [Alphaproteobacteria bacterium]
MLEQLSALARENSSDKRRELMREVADLFVSDSDRYTDRELFLFGEILTGLLNSVDTAAKVHLSETVAPVRETPRELALSLANQEIAVASPVLEYSRVLTEQDLVNVAHARATEHRLAISKRSYLSATVTDALIDHGEQPVLLSVSGNRTAEISSGGFHSLADHAANNPALCETLSHRDDMPVQIMKRVIPLLSEEAKTRLEELIAANGDSIVESLVEEASQRTREISQDSKQERTRSRLMLEEILNGKKELESVIETLCQEDRPLEVGFILAGVTGIPEQQAVNALMKKDGKALVILCRALEISEGIFSAIASLRGKRLKLSPSAEHEIMKQYSELDVTAAKRTMRFVKVRGTVTRP